MEAFANLYTDFANAVIYHKNHEAAPMHDLDLYNGAYSISTAKEGLELMEAMTQSAVKKTPVSLSYPISPSLTEIKFG
jgi:hypothetical protein